MPKLEVHIRTKDGALLSDPVKNAILKQLDIQLENANISYWPIESGAARIKTAIRSRIESATKAVSLIAGMKQEPIFVNYLPLIEKEYLFQIDQIKEGSFEDYQKVLANYLAHLDCITARPIFLKEGMCAQNHFKEWLALGDNYVSLISAKPILITLTTMTVDGQERYLVQAEKPLSPLTDEMAADYVVSKMGEWKKKMTPQERKLFQFVFKGKAKEEIRTLVGAIPSKLRTIPGVANFLRHYLFLIEKTGEISNIVPPRLRSSMASSRDLPKEAKALRQKFALDNYTCIILEGFREIIKNFGEVNEDNISTLIDKLECAPILLQTLISPLVNESMIPVPAGTIPPDKRLFKDKQRAIQEIRISGIKISIMDKEHIIKPRNLFDTNHPLNMAKSVMKTGGFLDSHIRRNIIGLPEDGFSDPSESTSQQLKYLSTYLKKYIKEIEDNACIPLFNELDSRLNEALSGTVGFNERELYLAGLEELIMGFLPDAISHGSCVSGKDRKGLETFYVDAMRLYWLLYKRIPKHNDSGLDRTRFVDLFVELYFTFHQHTSAGLNAPQADGIKMNRYLAADIVAAIEERSKNEIALSDAIAHNNELDGVHFTSLANSRSQYIFHLLLYINNPHVNIEVQAKLLFEKLNFIIQDPSWVYASSTLFGKMLPPGMRKMREISQSIEKPLMKLVKIATVANQYINQSEGSLKNIPFNDLLWPNEPTYENFYTFILALFCRENGLSLAINTINNHDFKISRDEFNLKELRTGISLP